MHEVIWYNSKVPKTFEKKSENLGIKVQASLLETLEKIRLKEDRPLGYVARELMLRGLALYQQDGQLRGDQKRGVSMLTKPIKLEDQRRKQKKVNTK